ncbi:MAG: alpha-ketoglutarate-dependent dioxygenase AlkB [Gemmatimonadetes bacterium]|nr:alpha-ketoglutarate-dependent dioxygenase AlkB [Gemmatimonadota bacterium]MYG17489.1 alpha-ketoglutarate-dependent dioxygenase AlkB [Gemmatimonadota bacterium]
MANDNPGIQSELNFGTKQEGPAATGDPPTTDGASTGDSAATDDTGQADNQMETAADQSSAENESRGRDLSTSEAVVTYKAKQVAARCLGLTVPHRRLLDALQNGWLPPPSEATGHMLGAGVFIREPGEPGKHAILVCLKLDVRKLPNLPAYVFRDEAWSYASPTETILEEEMWFWPGMLPTSAITELSVPTNEERIRLIGMADQLSNVALPVDVQITQAEDVLQGPFPQWSQQSTPNDHQTLTEIPAGMDAIHGALAMAVWAVPRIDPWLDLLVASLSDDQELLAELAVRTAAPWWRVPPWVRGQGRSEPLKQSVPEIAQEVQDALWCAAIDVLGDTSGNPGRNPQILAKRIADMARDAVSERVPRISDWLDDLCRVLRAESTIRPNLWCDFPVGLAIQLVLARQEPITFKNWPREQPNLPPSVWWSAAVLCGWGHGYRRLDTCFRGEPSLQEALSVHALRTSSPDHHGIAWPSMEGKPGWRKSGEGFELLWGKVTIARKSDTVRSRWYAADFSDERIRQEAFRVAKNLGWPCGHRRVRLPSESRIIVKGSYVMEVGEGKRSTEIRGEMDIQLPSNTEVDEVLDKNAFREHIASAPGSLTEPPAPHTPALHVGTNAEESPKDSTLVPGLRYVPGFLNEAEEIEITGKIDEDQANWSNVLKRRVQHYGWRYDYKAGQIDRRMRIGPLPGWAAKIARRLVDQGLVPDEPDQLIVNEYRGKQGIAKHVDSIASFNDYIAMISLLESWEMVFRKGLEKRPVQLERGSAAVMSGPSRTQWTHEIPARQNELGPIMPDGKRKKVPRERRLSLTFRRVTGST